MKSMGWLLSIATVSVACAYAGAELPKTIRFGVEPA